MHYAIYLRWSEEDKAWIAEVPDLPGCMADGKTQADALREAAKAIKLWLEVAEEDGRDIPQPKDPGEASGNFVARIPKSLHRRLQILAQREHVSLNQLVVSLLAQREAEERTRGR